jgi:hypothetical protein
MMWIVLATALQGQVVAQDLGPSDVPAMVEAALHVALPPGDQITTAAGAVRVGDRPLFFDVRAAASAFRASLLPQMPDAFVPTRRRHQVRSQQDVIQCTPSIAATMSGCSVVEDGIVVTISTARSTGEEGEYLVSVLVQWDGGRLITGYDMELFLSKVEGEWRVIRQGIVTVIN